MFNSAKERLIVISNSNRSILYIRAAKAESSFSWDYLQQDCLIREDLEVEILKVRKQLTSGVFCYGKRCSLSKI